MSKVLILVIASALAISGCGGGSTTSVSAQLPSITTVDDFPVEPVFVALASTTVSFAAGATDTAGNKYDVSISFAPIPDKSTPLSASPLKAYSTTVVLKKNGTIASTVSTENYYSVSPYLLWGSHNSQNDWVNAKQRIAPPQTSKVATSGPLFTGEIAFNNSSFDVHPQTATWSLERDSPTTAWHCINVQTNLTAGNRIGSSCFRINSSGQISGFKSDATSGGVTLQFR